MNAIIYMGLILVIFGACMLPLPSRASIEIHWLAVAFGLFFIARGADGIIEEQEWNDVRIYVQKELDDIFAGRKW